MTTAADELALNSVALTGCRQVTDGERSRPFCEIAIETAVARKSQLEEVAQLCTDALTHIDDIPVVADLLRRAVTRAQVEDLAVEVPDDHLVLTIVRALENIITAEPSALVEQAHEVRSFIAEGGWIVIRAEGCLS